MFRFFKRRPLLSTFLVLVLAVIVNEHEQLMKAFRTRNSEAARQVWRQHLWNTGQSVTDVLRSQGLG